MKHAFRAAAALFCLVNPALAGGPTLIEDPVVFPPFPEGQPGPDWTGPYVGLSYGHTTADQTDQNPTVEYDVSDGSARSLFFGYRLQQGNIVYGGEMELANLSGSEVGVLPRQFSKAYDLKSTLGYARGRLLAYGILAWSQVEVVRPAGSTNYGGISYGAGVEYSINDRFGLGLEYLSRNVDGNSLSGAPQTTDVELDSISLRIGFSF